MTVIRNTKSWILRALLFYSKEKTVFYLNRSLILRALQLFLLCLLKYLSIWIVRYHLKVLLLSICLLIWEATSHLLLQLVKSLSRFSKHAPLSICIKNLGRIYRNKFSAFSRAYALTGGLFVQKIAPLTQKFRALPLEIHFVYVSLFLSLSFKWYFQNFRYSFN